MHLLIFPQNMAGRLPKTYKTGIFKAKQTSRFFNQELAKHETRDQDVELKTIELDTIEQMIALMDEMSQNGNIDPQFHRSGAALFGNEYKGINLPALSFQFA